MILIDLQKAFDTINHDILISKMKHLGFSKEATLWFKSYLSNRKFKVHINKTFSESGNLLCGVPQGSILGPLLFLLYELYFPVENNGINTRFSFQKHTLPYLHLSYIGPSLWNNLQNTLKSATTINAFKHSIKNHYFNELKKKES